MSGIVIAAIICTLRLKCHYTLIALRKDRARVKIWQHLCIAGISLLLGTAVTGLFGPWTPAVCLMPLVDALSRVFDPGLERDIGFQLISVCILNVGFCVVILEGGCLLWTRRREAKKPTWKNQ
jgi:hypothetical protein